MKKYIILAAAAVAAMAACSKVVETPDAQREINFTVANRVQTKAAYSTDDTFGTYAWYTANSASVAATTGSDHAAFMVNEEVGYVNPVWKTLHNTFYWPKTGSIDFISYSPFDGTNNTADSNPAVTQTTITYTGIDTAELDSQDNPKNIDYMYADKVTCTINDNTTPAQTAVPTVFRHALAKVGFKMKANFVSYTDATTGQTTTWDVYVKSVKVSGFKTIGDCVLTWSNNEWVKPVTTVGSVEYNVWTNLSGSSAEQELIADADPDDDTKWLLLTEDADDNVINSATGFVMPQILEASATNAPAQQIKLQIHITTHLSNGRTIEEDYNPTLDIMDLSNLKAWQMNQNIVYTIKIKPVAYVSTYDDPDDVIITFDPTVADWTNVNASATIQL